VKMGTKQSVATNNNSQMEDSSSVSTAAPTNVGYKQDVNALPAQKSVVIAYVLWLFGGIFGLHHLYLHRDRHAFVWWCTLGGYIIGWLCEIFLIPEYVRAANEDPRFVTTFKAKLKANKRPPLSLMRFLGQILIGYLFGELCSSAIPQTVTAGIDFTWLHWCIPIFIALGVWTVGNIGLECGTLWPCVSGAIVTYLARYFIYDETCSLLLTALISALVFVAISKQWRRTPPRRRSPKERTLKFTGALCIYFGLWGCVILFDSSIQTYYYESITDENGGEVPIHDALYNFLVYALWTDLEQVLLNTDYYAQYHGWFEKRNAYKMLGVSATASRADITAAYRKLSKKNHPDKIKDEALRPAAHQRFIEIQQAYKTIKA